MPVDLMAAPKASITPRAVDTIWPRLRNRKPSWVTCVMIPWNGIMTPPIFSLRSPMVFDNAFI